MQLWMSQLLVEYNMTLADVCSDASVYSVLSCVVHNKHIIYTERWAIGYYDCQMVSVSDYMS